MRLGSTGGFRRRRDSSATILDRGRSTNPSPAHMPQHQRAANGGQRTVGSSTGTPVLPCCTANRGSLSVDARAGQSVHPTADRSRAILPYLLVVCSGWVRRLLLFGPDRSSIANRGKKAAGSWQGVAERQPCEAKWQHSRQQRGLLSEIGRRGPNLLAEPADGVVPHEIGVGDVPF